MGKRLGGGRTRTADPYWLYHVLSHSEIKVQGTRKKGGWSRLWCSLCEQRPCLSGSGQTSACLWELVNEFLFSLCLSIRLPLSPLNYHYLSPWVCLPSFYYLFPWETGVSKMPGWCFAIGWGQPTTGAFQLKWLWSYDISLHVFLTLSIGFKKHFKMLLGRRYSLKNLDCHKLSQVLGFGVFLCEKYDKFCIGQYPRRATDQQLLQAKNLYIYLPTASISIHWKVREEQSQGSWSKTEKNDYMTHHTPHSVWVCVNSDMFKICKAFLLLWVFTEDSWATVVIQQPNKKRLPDALNLPSSQRGK